MKTYKLNNIEVSESELKKLIQANPELLKEENKSRYFTPELGEGYYLINYTGKVDIHTHIVSSYKPQIFMGAYRTKKEAELARDKQLALVRMWNYADEKMFFRPDWSNEEQAKYCVQYCYQKKKFSEGHWEYTQSDFLFPYFKSRGDCEQFIKDNQKDLELFIK